MKKFVTLAGMFRSVLAVALVAGAALSSAAATKDLGYVQLNQNPVYAYDGYAENADASAHFGVKLTSALMHNYAGAKIVGFRVGWSCSYEDGEVDLFVREGDFNAPDKVSKHAAVTFKTEWNTIMLDEPYIIPENPGDIMIGYHVNLKANTICIPFSVLGKKPDNSAFIAFDDHLDAEGNKIWSNVSSQTDALLLLAIVEMEGDITNRAEINDIRTPGFQLLGATDTGLYQITNQGTSPISSMTLHFVCDTLEKDMDIELSKPIEVDVTAKISLPVPAMATGMTTVSISKINGKENTYKSSKTFEVVAVPEEISEQFPRRSLLEYYVSENTHLNPGNFDNYLMPGYKPYADRMSLVCHHMNDQFMTRDDEDTQMLLDFADGDKSKVFSSVITIDRTLIPGNIIVRDKDLSFAVPAPQYAPSIYNVALAMPTFASVAIANEYDATNGKLKINVSGTITDSILPAGENLKLTVYVLEDNVASTAQDWATPEQEAEYGGVYHHQAVIRQQPVPIWGDEINGAGDFNASYEVEIDTEEWKSTDMRVVALLHRSEKNIATSRQVVNCAESIFDESSIREINADGRGVIINVNADRSIAVNGSTDGVKVYTTSGALTANRALTAGIYVISTGNLTAKVLVK